MRCSIGGEDTGWSRLQGQAKNAPCPTLPLELARWCTLTVSKWGESHDRRSDTDVSHRRGRRPDGAVAGHASVLRATGAARPPVAQQRRVPCLRRVDAGAGAVHQAGPRRSVAASTTSGNSSPSTRGLVVSVVGSGTWWRRSWSRSTNVSGSCGRSAGRWWKRSRSATPCSPSSQMPSVPWWSRGRRPARRRRVRNPAAG